MPQTSRVFVIYYHRQIICDDYLLYIPCSYGEGNVDRVDHTFIDDTGNIYNACDSYEIITNPNQDLTYFFDITAKDLQNRYQLHNEYEALAKYYEEIKKFVLFGRIDEQYKFIDIMPLDKNQIKMLTDPVTYSVSNGEGKVEISTTQLKTILNYGRLSDVRRILGTFLSRTIATKKIVSDSKNNILSIQTSFDGRHIGETRGETVLLTGSVVEEARRLKMHQDNSKAVATTTPQTMPVPHKSQLDATDGMPLHSVHDLYHDITSSLIGQDDVVQDIISVVMANATANDPKEIIKPFIIGQTGSGKSLLFKLLGEKLNIPVITIDCNMITQEGYKGKSVLDILVDLYYLCDKSVEKAERAIIFLDEADKIASHGNDVSDVGAQQALLKLIEGSRFAIDVDKYGNKVVIDTSLMTIAGGGAFEGIFERASRKLGFGNTLEEMQDHILTLDELREYGMTKEFVGRWGLFRQYHPVTKEMLMDDLERGSLSPIAIKKKVYLRNFGITIDFTPSYKEALCDMAIGRKSGFRGLDEIVNNSLIKAQFALQTSDSPYTKLIVTKETIENPNTFQLVK